MYSIVLLTFILHFSVQNSKCSDLRVLEFKRDCMQGLSRIVKKIQEKSPLKYSTVREMDCLDPTVMSRDPDGCKAKMKGVCGVCAGRSSRQG